MDGHRPETCGDRIADTYDDMYGEVPAAMIDRLAGLRLLERRGGWDGEPFTGEGIHVSVWGR